MKKIISIFCALSVMFCCCSCSAGANGRLQKFSKSFTDLFDTATTVIAYDTSQKDFEKHFDAFYNRLSNYNNLFNIYNEYDDTVNLCTLNKSAKDGPVKVDSKIIDLLEYGKYVYKLSGGKTNICFGSVLNLWHNASETAKSTPNLAQIPDAKSLQSASKHTNIDDLIIDKNNSSVQFSDPDLKIDVGAIAKGFAVRETGEWAKENLWQSGIINSGGNVYAFGTKNNDGKTPWNIAIENPDRKSDSYLYTLNVSDKAVVTSGNYQRYFTVDKKRYCHIINTQTLMPSEYVSAVSVICDDSALGDALSTTLFNMPISDGLRLVESMDSVEAVWTDNDYKSTYSSGFEKYITGN